MKERNLWENELGKNFTYINDINELLQKIESDEFSYNFDVKTTFTPDDEPFQRMDAIAKERQIILNYTDNEHNVALASKDNFFFKTVINPEFLEKHKEEIKKSIIKNIENTTSRTIYINKYIFDNDIFRALVARKNLAIHFIDVSLSEEQIKELKANYIEARITGTDESLVQISSQYVFSSYTKENLEALDKLIIHLPENLSQIKNLIFAKENIEISFKFNNISEEEKMKLISQCLIELENLDKSFKINITVEKRSNFEKYIGNAQFKNLILTIENDSYNYPYQQYLEEEKILEKLVEPIKKANMTPLEKYLAVYEVVKSFKPYKESDIKEEARYLRHILYNDYIVCVGYSKLLITLLDKVGINAQEFSCDVDVSYVNGFTVEEKVVDFSGHARVIFNIDDPKYNVAGLYMADPTWDNSQTSNHLNHAVMTFDQMQISNLMFKYSMANVLLDIHSKEEFNDQVNFILKREFANDQKIFGTNRPFIKSYLFVCQKIIDSFRCDPKHYEFLEKLKSCKNEKNCDELLTEIRDYLLTRINKPVSEEVIFQASMESMKKVHQYSREEINELYETTKNDFYNRQRAYFPYEFGKNDLDLKAKAK